MTFAAFLKKELMEITRTSKIIILPVLFVFFGILSPLSAKYMNQILALASEQQGISIKMPDPTFVQSYEQFFKNLYFMMIIICILVFAGMVSEEKSKGTILLVMTKCLSRNGFIIGKLTSAILLFTLSYAASAGACLYYTSLLFPEFVNTGVWTGLALYWVFGLFIVTMTMLASLLSKSLINSAVISFIGYAAVSAIAAIPYAGEYSPGALQGWSVKLAEGLAVPGDSLAAAGATLGLTAVCVLVSLIAFRRQEL